MSECGLFEIGSQCSSVFPYIFVLTISVALMLAIHFVLRGFEFFMDLSVRVAALGYGDSASGEGEGLRGAPERTSRAMRRVGPKKRGVITSRK